jgi:hypothetical protein
MQAAATGGVFSERRSGAILDAHSKSAKRKMRFSGLGMKYKYFYCMQYASQLFYAALFYKAP